MFVLRHETVLGNHLFPAGAMYVYDSKVNVDGNSSFQHNKANDSGGKNRSGRLGVSE